jgi:hypothetical protein
VARVAEQQRLLEQLHIKTGSLHDYCVRVTQNLRRLDLTEQRRAFAALNITVTWHPEKPLDIRGSIPVDIATNAHG